MSTASFGAVLVLGACGGDDPDGQATPTDPPAASALAPSQTTPDTTTAPPLPPPCDPSVLEFSASSPLADTGVTLRVDNTGDVRCEATFGESPIVDPAMEPDVWLDAGGAGELTVAVESTSCDEPGPVDAIGLVVNGEPVAVAVDPIEACTIVLVALYPIGV